MFARRIILRAIKLYQATLSPDHGPMRHRYPAGYCRFQPTCSEYGYEAIEKHGIVKGSFLALWRIIRCNPWSRGGHDPVP